MGPNSKPSVFTGILLQSMLWMEFVLPMSSILSMPIHQVFHFSFSFLMLISVLLYFSMARSPYFIGSAVELLWNDRAMPLSPYIILSSFRHLNFHKQVSSVSSPHNGRYFFPEKVASRSVKFDWCTKSYISPHPCATWNMVDIASQYLSSNMSSQSEANSGQQNTTLKFWKDCS